MKTLIAALALAALAGTAVAQVADPAPRVPTGYEVPGPTCLVEVGNQTYHAANCDANGRVVDWLLLQDSLNNRSTPNRVLFDLGGGAQ